MNDRLSLIDSDILSYILKRKENVYNCAYNYLKIYGKFSISCLTYYECLRGYKAVNASKRLQIFHDFMNITSVLYLDQRVMEKASEIYAVLKQKGKIPGEFDILIAATAISNDLILISNNERHYQPMEQYFSLKLENWNKRNT